MVYSNRVALWTPRIGGSDNQCATGQLDAALRTSADHLANQLMGYLKQLQEKTHGEGTARRQSPDAAPSPLALKATLLDANNNLVLEGGEKVGIRIDVTNTGKTVLGGVSPGDAVHDYAYLMKRDDPGHDVRVYERDPENATYGWGVVFSDIALAFVRDIAPELYDAMTAHKEVFDEMAVVHQGVHVTLAHNTFHRMARIDLLRALHAQCRKVGVEIAFDHRVDDPAALGPCDLIVAADGANSAIRTRDREHF